MPARPDHLTLIIGGMKCGSTTLFRTLAHHPQVCPSRKKETDFFSNPLRWRKGWRWYHRRFRVRPHHRTALEASPSYAKVHRHPETPRRIGSAPQDVDVVYVVRDPVERIRSHVQHAMWAPWGQTLVREPERVFRGPLAASDYAMQLDAYEEHVDRDRIHVVTLDGLRATPRKTLDRLQETLGLERRRLAVETRNRAAATPWQARRIWQTLHRHAPAPGGRRAVRAAAYQARRIPGIRHLLFRPQERLPLPSGWEDEVRRRLAPSMRRLRSRWGVDVGAWGF